MTTISEISAVRVNAAPIAKARNFLPTRSSPLPISVRPIRSRSSASTCPHRSGPLDVSDDATRQEPFRAAIRYLGWRCGYVIGEHAEGSNLAADDEGSRVRGAIAHLLEKGNSCALEFCHHRLRHRTLQKLSAVTNLSRIFGEACGLLLEVATPGARFRLSEFGISARHTTCFGGFA